MRRKLLMLLAAAALTAAPAFAYKEEVHRIITTKAFDAFINQRNVLQELGIDASRRADLQWYIGQGAVDEDAFPNPLNHFFDPVHDAPLTIEVPTFSIMFPFVLTGITCSPAPGAKTAKDWALHDPTNFDGGLDAARGLLHGAVAGSIKGDRDNAALELFMTLGHIVHLIQDMAQPEHTRNDQHLPHTELFLSNGTKASLYEEWGIPNIASTDPAQPPIIDYGGYPDVALPDYASYFHTPERS